jgi:hypothetical protein
LKRPAELIETGAERDLKEIARLFSGDEPKFLQPEEPTVEKGVLTWPD